MHSTSNLSRRQDATLEGLCLLRADLPAAPVRSGRPPAKAKRHLGPMAVSLLLHAVGLGFFVLLGVSPSEPPQQQPEPVRICAIQECLESPPVEFLLPVDVPLEIPPPLKTPEEFPEEQTYLPPEEMLERPLEQTLAEPLDLPVLPLTVVKSRPATRPTALPPVPAAPALPPIARRPAPRRAPVRVARRPPTRAPAAPAPRVRGPASPLKLRFAPNPDRYYPLLARRLGLSGSTVIELAVDAQGRVTDVKLVRSSGHASLDGAALALGRAYRFAPIDGRRRVRVPVQFQLRGRTTRRG